MSFDAAPDPGSGPEAIWQAALADGRILLQREPGSGRAHYPPRLPDVTTPALEWVEASGRGTVHSFTIIHARPPEASYNVALIDLEEGARMMSRVDGIAADDLVVGLPVVASIAASEQGPLVVFHPA